MSVLICGCINETDEKYSEKKLDGNYTRILHAVLNKSWKQQPTKQQLYSNLPPILQTIQDEQNMQGTAGLVWFGLVYSTSTIVGYLMPNPFLYI